VQQATGGAALTPPRSCEPEWGASTESAVPLQQPLVAGRCVAGPALPAIPPVPGARLCKQLRRSRLPQDSRKRPANESPSPPDTVCPASCRRSAGSLRSPRESEQGCRTGVRRRGAAEGARNGPVQRHSLGRGQCWSARQRPHAHGLMALPASAQAAVHVVQRKLARKQARSGSYDTRGKCHDRAPGSAVRAQRLVSHLDCSGCEDV